MSLDLDHIVIFHNQGTRLTFWDQILKDKGFEISLYPKEELQNNPVYINKIYPDLILTEEKKGAGQVDFTFYDRITGNFPGIPLISVISRDKEDYIEELIRAGASDFIYEHSDIEEVVTRLRSHLVTNKKEANLKVSPPGSNSSLLYNQLFSKTFHSPGVLMAITTLDEGEFIDVNSAFLNLLGYKRDEIIGKTVKELGIHQSYERRDEVIAQLKKGMKITERELTIYNKWGEKRIGYASFEIINIQGESYLLTTWDDITSLKHYEQQLNKLYMAIGQSSSMVIIAEPDGRITFANNQFFRETGYNSEDLSKADVNLFNYVYPDKHNINDIWNRLNSGEIWEGEVLNTKKNGETFWE
ncbi:MAG: PAS domain S-box protein, partial [Bacteroidota bacterium]